jgi:hypothetical protein
MRRPLALLTALLAAVALGACGNKEEEILHGINEGSYLDLGELKYQVQISRILNPSSVEDRAYLVGLDAAQRRLKAGEQWFGVFIRVENETDEPRPAAQDYRIIDTQETEFRPVSLPPENVFAFRGGTVPANGVLPPLDSPAEQGSIQGSLLLYKIPNVNLENRPMEFSIRNPTVTEEVATVDLDI